MSRGLSSVWELAAECGCQKCILLRLGGKAIPLMHEMPRVFIGQQQDGPTRPSASLLLHYCRCCCFRYGASQSCCMLEGPPEGHPQVTLAASEQRGRVCSRGSYILIGTHPPDLHGTKWKQIKC